jgi:hypothetical protein
VKTKLLAITSASVLALGLARGQGTDDLLKARFLAEYPKALEAWGAKIATAEAVVRTTKDVIQGKPAARTILSSVKCDLPHAEVMVESLERDGIRLEQASGYNEKYAFSLGRTGEQKEFAIDKFEAREPGRRPLNLPVGAYLRFPYSMEGSAMGGVNKPGFALRSVSPVRRDGRDLLRVTYRVTLDQKKLKTKPGRTGGAYLGPDVSLLLSPEERWVLYEYEWRMRGGDSPKGFRGTVEYQGTLDGFPVPKRATRTIFDIASDQVIESSTFEFLQFSFGKAPDSAFTLSAFGVPEPVAKPLKVARSGSLVYWFLGLGLAALTAAAVFKAASSRLGRVAEE